ncbi:MAG: diaminopimelate epimerase [Saprospiraceae bacterium]
MDNIPFYKYQGAGNDFVILDQRSTTYLHHDQQALIERICDRKFGIGADGLMLLENDPNYDFRMVYFNADGKEGSMCGNGGRCIVAFAHHLGVISEHCSFIAVDGPHEAFVKAANYVELKMQDVDQLERGADFFVLDTGSPHYIEFVEQIDQLPVVEKGRAIRYSERFKSEGINVNFVAVNDPQSLSIATYERGVEDETLACGTGVTAAAIAHHLQSGQKGANTISLKAKGGQLEVRLEEKEQKFTNIWLCGPAEKVFRGKFSGDEIMNC